MRIPAFDCAYLTIDYLIEQVNADQWNLLLGLNWEINSRWSLSAEYDGFEGSRQKPCSNPRSTRSRRTS